MTSQQLRHTPSPSQAMSLKQELLRWEATVNVLTLLEQSEIPQDRWVQATKKKDRLYELQKVCRLS
jgi:hypothetical protein